MKSSDWETLPEQTRIDVLSIARDLHLEKSIPATDYNVNVIKEQNKIGWPSLLEEHSGSSTHLP